MDAGAKAVRRSQKESTDESDLLSRWTGRKRSQLMVSPSDKVDDVMRQILNNEKKSSKSDVYLTCEGRVLGRSEDLRSSGWMRSANHEHDARWRKTQKQEEQS